MITKYDNEACNKFVRDMTKAGYDVRHYRGRWFWEGPAVAVDSPQDGQSVIRATRVMLQSDALGLGVIYYPVASGKEVAP